MQSHNGTAYDPENSKETMHKMIQDGTQGTPSGKGLVQYLDQYPDAYSAARGYNSGAVASSGDLSDAIGATQCYASDVANRLTGWVKAEPKCGNEAQSDGYTNSQGSTQSQGTTQSTTQGTTSTSQDGQWQPDSAANSGQWVPDSGASSGQWQG